MPKITSVIGLGYLGVTQAAVLASLGHRVLGIDPDQTKIDSLNAGKVPFFEPELQELLESGIRSGLLTFDTAISESAKEVDVHFICVGTPSKSDGSEVDTSFLHKALEQLAPFLKQNSTIVGRSTVPVGTAATLENYLFSITDTKFDLVWNPEFLSEGTAVRDSLKPERIVIGTNSQKGESALRDIYKKIIDKNVPVFTIDRQTSELVKVASNAFLALKISYINGVAEIAEKTGASTAKLADAMGLDTRIGRKFLNNGLGFGGGCLPKDLAGFASVAKATGAKHFGELLDSVNSINSDRRQHVHSLAVELLGNVAGKKITVLGAAFKPNTDDIRLSPGLLLAEELRREGAFVTIHDPIALPKVSEMYPKLIQGETIESAAADADLLIVATEWSDYKELDATKLRAIVKRPALIDARNILPSVEWRRLGWNIKQLGEGS